MEQVIAAFQALMAGVEASPLWVQIWVNFMGLIVFWLAAFFSFVRVEARWTLAATIGAVIVMLVLISHLGYGRHLGLGHVIFWTPLAIYLWKRRELWNVRGSWSGKWIAALFATISISLVIDYVDVARYLLNA